MECVRIYEIPNCEMATSKCGMFGEGKLEEFSEWFSSLPITMFPRDFLYYDKEKSGFIWMYMLNNEISLPKEFTSTHFVGGLYAVSTDIDGNDNTETMLQINQFIEKSNVFIKDETRQELGNIITPKSARGKLGYNQMDYYVPIKIR